MKHKDGLCPSCGSACLVLAQDQTRRTHVVYVNGAFVHTNTEVADQEEENSLRFYCFDCGEELEVP